MLSKCQIFYVIPVYYNLFTNNIHEEKYICLIILNMIKKIIYYGVVNKLIFIPLGREVIACRHQKGYWCVAVYVVVV